MSSFRTSSLFHYTNNLTKIKGILKKGLTPQYSAEDLRYKDENHEETGLFIGLPMVSFCDIPISKIEEHSKRYGKFAIGLKKDKLIKLGTINPIMYASTNNVLESVLNTCLEAESATGEYRNLLHNRTFSINEMSPVFSNKNRKIKTRDFLIGYIKKYYGIYKKNKIVNYEENEWRYIVERKGKLIPWYWSEDSYAKSRLSEGNYEQWKLSKENYVNWKQSLRVKEKKSNQASELEKETLTFKIDNISWIIVPKDSDVNKITQFINKLKKVGGSDQRLSVADKSLLCSKIISLEKIEQDL